MTTIPVIMTTSEMTSPAIPAGVLLSFSFRNRLPRAMEITGSQAVMIASTGAIRVPRW